MPLEKSTDKGAIWRNAKKMMDEGYPRERAFAAAYRTYRSAKAKLAAKKRKRTKKD